MGCGSFLLWNAVQIAGARHASPVSEAAIGRPFLCSAPFPASCFLMCHCEERSDVAISQYTIWITGRPRRKRKRLLEIATAPSGPRNDKLGSLMPMNLRCMICKCTRRSLSAATDAIGVYHFNGSQYELGVHCRERHAAPLHGVCGRQSAAAFPSAIRYDVQEGRPTGRPQLVKKSLRAFSPSCFQNCKVNFCIMILQFCRCGG